MSNLGKSIFSIMGLLALAISIYALSNTQFMSSTTRRSRPHNMVYFKDDSTSLCYAYASGSVTYVPCTEAVEKAIQEDK